MRFFIVKDNNGIIREKQVYSGDDVSINALISTFMASNPTLSVTEVDKHTFDTTAIIVDQVPLRNDALEILDSTDPSSKLQRALILVLIDELNFLRERFNDLAADVSAAVSLADLKARWAIHPTLTDRTLNQVKPAIQAKITNGTAD